MKTRIISAMCMVPFAIFFFLGGIPLFLFNMLLAIMALWEFYRGFNSMNIHPEKGLGYFFTVILFLLVLRKMLGLSGTGLDLEVYFCAWLVLSIAACLGYTLKVKDHNLEDGISTLIGILYVSLFFVHISLVSTLPGGNIYLWLVLLIAFGNDTFAYFGGYFFGKHKLAPVISPKKTIEGSVIGILCTVLASCVFSYFLLPGQMLKIAVLVLFASPVSQIGDLVASCFKRKMGIKDYSNLIPGHGGILDRFDSVIMVAPFVYYYLLIVK